MQSKVRELFAPDHPQTLNSQNKTQNLKIFRPTRILLFILQYSKLNIPQCIIYIYRKECQKVPYSDFEIPLMTTKLWQRQ